MFDWQFRQSYFEQKELDMNWHSVEGNWKQCKGKVKAGWRKLTDDHLDVIADMRVESTLEKASPKEERMMKEEVFSRREVLRGALAVGCSLLAPAFFSSLAYSATSAAPQATAKKVSPASVKYQTHPKGEQKCSKCVNFIAESSTCKVVEGKISPEGWCVLWAKKA
jgi:uncharacterized protein YjbJ (UPF0337 family)